MKIVYQDLLNFLSSNPSKDILSEKLFQLGHEHEIIGDVFHMDLTPNRGDCLSLLGLSRDLNTFFGMSKPVDIYEDDIEELKINFDNLAPDDCNKVSFLEIEIDEPVFKYKPYLESYFNSLSIKKTNFFADISNYVSYELGQPTHCYDSEFLNGNIVFESKKCESLFETLLGSKIQLTDNNCVFSMNNKIISLAGVMGGASTACSDKTKKVLIECAHFNPESIIGKSLKYNLTSDAAHKFERGVDINCQEKVLRRFIKIVMDHTNVKTIKYKSFTSIEHEDVYIPNNINKINKILGIKLDESTFNTYLEDLGFEFCENGLKVPTHRSDIKTQNDIAEEVARIIGYNNIKNIPINLNKASNEKRINKIAIIESFLSKNGFAQVINFPFTSKDEKESIKIANPLDANKINLRLNIKDSLVENLLFNERRQQDSIKLFEISDIYKKINSEIQQKKYLGIIISGRQGNNYNNFAKKLDYEYLDQVLNNYSGKKIFEIQEISRVNLSSKKKDKIFYVEIAVDDIPESFFSKLNVEKSSINFISYKPISDFPSSTRDFSFSITNLKVVNKIIDQLDNISDEIIKNSFLFDFYKNDKSSSVKLGYRFVFQSNSKTLSDEEINQKIQEILSPILKIDGVSIPGM